MKELVLRLLSLVWDIPIQKTSSPQNKYLEVVWSNGRKMLNTSEANFSFGSDYAVFDKAMDMVSLEIAEAHSALILGFGCGSILDLLEKKHCYQGSIDGVEYDAEIISLFHTHFVHEYTSTPHLHIADAEQYVANCQKKYDLIFIDLFVELENTPFVFSPLFLENIARLSSSTGIVVYNIIKQTEEEKLLLSEMILNLSTYFKNVSSSSFQEINTILIAK